MVRTVHDRRQDRRSGVGRIVVPLLLLGALAVGVAKVGDLWPSISNPFGTETVDRSQPALLEALEDLSEYRAASGNFQVVVDLEKDARFLPGFVRGERTLFVGAGSVDAIVNFAGLDQRAISMSPDRKSITITLPKPFLTEPAVDPGQSHVVSRERGILDRIGGVFSDNPTSDKPLYVLAEQKMAAAAAQSDLVSRAEVNTRTMLETLVRSLGFEHVTIRFEASANPA